MIRAGALFLLALSLLLCVQRPARAAESYDNCTGFVTSLPAVISTQGTWCLKQDLATAMTSGNAIDIQTNNVTIDCNDFKLGGLAAGLTTQTIGINATNRLNATVRHCNIRGFLDGLSFVGSTGGGHAIEDNLFDGNTYSGLFVEGDGSVVRRNRIFNTGQTTHYNYAFGITTSLSVDILDNMVSGVFARTGANGTAYGIYSSDNSDGSISDNRIRGLVKDGAGITFGIANISSGQLTLRNNDVVGDSSTGSLGVFCSNSSGRAKDNIIVGFATGLTDCSNDGGNVVAP